MTRPSVCRSCGAPMMWATSAASGKPMPLDPDPVDGGNVVLEQDLVGGYLATVLAGPAAVAAAMRGEPLYLAHHATCPHADRWRRG